MMRRRIALAATAALVLALSACAGLPTSGPVSAGLPAGEEEVAPDLSFLPDGPQRDATPEEIVDGFVEAAASPEQDWQIAKQFLTADFREEWKPTSGVTVYEAADRTLVADGESVTLTVTVVADVDDSGVLHVTAHERSALGYTLSQENGQWRISGAPEGLTVDQAFFDKVFDPYTLVFYDTSWTYLVPDVRWFPPLNVPARIAHELIDGDAATWLVGSVNSAFPAEVSLAGGGAVVTTSARIAQVELSARAADLDSETLARMQRQLRESLRSASIPDVQMRVDGSTLDVEPAAVASTSLDPNPIVRTDEGVGRLTADTLSPLPGELSPALASLPLRSIALGAAQDVAAVQLESGAVARVGGDGRWAVIDERSGLIRPRISAAAKDPEIWSVPGSAPQALTAFRADGTPVAVQGAWPEASRVWEFALADDGVRVAAAITIDGGVWLVVASIVDGDGAMALGPIERVAQLSAPARGLVWLDEKTVGVLVGDGESGRVLTQEIGGLGSTASVPQGDILDIAPGTSVSTLRLLAADGVLYTRRGAAWTQSSDGVQMLGTQLAPR